MYLGQKLSASYPKMMMLLFVNTTGYPQDHNFVVGAFAICNQEVGQQLSILHDSVEDAVQGLDGNGP